MIVRKAKKEDIDGIFDCFLDMVKSEDLSSSKIDKSLMLIRQRRKDFQFSGKKELLREIRERNSLYLVAEEGSNIAGYIYGTVKNQKSPFFKSVIIAYLNAIVVKKRYRGKKVASLLRDEMMEWFKSKKCILLYLDVFDKNPAVEIYKKWDYKIVNFRMVKKL